MEERSIRFLIGATYDVLPTPQNLKLAYTEGYIIRLIVEFRELFTESGPFVL